jgi:hypothetical protein
MGRDGMGGSSDENLHNNSRYLNTLLMDEDDDSIMVKSFVV